MFKQKNIALIWIFSAIGLAIGIYLTWLHQQIFTGKLEDFGFCGISRGFSCETVSASPYSKMFGVPLAWMGAMLYLFWLALASASLLGAEKHAKNVNSLILATAIVAIAVDIYLAQLMFFTIGSICLLCLLTYLLNLAILFLALRNSNIPLIKSMTSAIKLLLPFSGQTRFGFILIFILVVAAGAYGQVWMQKGIEAASKFDADGFRQYQKNFTRLKVDSSSDPFHGKEDARLTIIEFSDFQCPHCRKAHVILQTVLPGYGDQVKLVFINKPLKFHHSAKALAQLAEAAYMQGKFWPLHDLIFERQAEFKDTPLDKDALMDFAKDAGLDMARLEKDYENAATSEAVEADLLKAKRLKIESTPVFLFNGLLIRGMPPPAQLKKIIELELEFEAQQQQ